MQKAFWQRIKKALGSGLLALMLILPATTAVTVAPTPAHALDIVYDPTGWAASAVQWAKEIAQWVLEQAQWIMENLQRAFAAVTDVLKDLLGEEIDNARADAKSAHDAAIDAAGRAGQILGSYVQNPNSRFCLKAQETRSRGAGGGGGGNSPGGNSDPSNPECDRDPSCGQNSLKGQNWRVAFAARGGNWKPGIDIGEENFRKLGGVPATEETWRLINDFDKIFKTEICITRPTKGERDSVFKAANGADAGDAYRGIGDMKKKKFIAAQILKEKLAGPSGAATFGNVLSPAGIAAQDAIDQAASRQSTNLSALNELIQYIMAPEQPETEEERKFVATWPKLRQDLSTWKLAADYPELGRFASEPICQRAAMLINLWKGVSTEMQNTHYATYETDYERDSKLDLSWNRIENEENRFALVVANASAAANASLMAAHTNAPVDNVKQGSLDNTPMTPKQVAAMTGEPLKIVEARFKKWEQEQLRAIAANAKAKRERNADPADATAAADDVDVEQEPSIADLTTESTPSVELASVKTKPDKQAAVPAGMLQSFIERVGAATQ
jgi:hypothetical protein